MKRKLSSRKLWAAIVGVIVGLAMAFGLDETEISTITGASVSVLSVITYIYTEGKIDSIGITNAVDDVQNAVDEVTKNEQ